MLVHRSVNASITKFAGYPFIHLGGETQSVKRLAQEHNTVSLARDEGTNHEALVLI